MTDNKPRQRFRVHKESKGQNRGSKRTPLTPLQGVLINNSGSLGHRLRRPPTIYKTPKKSKWRNDA